MNDSPSSEERFQSLHDHQSAVNAIVEATREFEKAKGVQLCVAAAGDDIPVLSSDASFRYRDQYVPFAEALRRGEEVTIVIVTDADAVIAFGFGEVPSGNAVEIMTIDVEQASRRSAEVKSSVTIEDMTFEVGIGHVLVLGLIDSCTADVLHTNATGAQARYIFSSLGFVSADEDNDCLMRLEKSEPGQE